MKRQIIYKGLRQKTRSGSLHACAAPSLRTPKHVMRKLIATVVLSGALGAAAFAQGTVNFANIGAGLDAPVYLSDGTTKLDGPQYIAGLLAGPTASSLALIAMTPFLSGNAAGYYVGGVLTINSVQGGDVAFIQVDVWNAAAGATFDQARASGFGNAWAQSSVFSVETGNQGTPPTTPSTLLGLTPLSLNAGTPIPEHLSFFQETVRTGTNSLAVSPQRAMVLTWSDPGFSLQVSTNAAGIYTNVVCAASPYTNNIAGSALFFRLISN